MVASDGTITRIAGTGSPCSTPTCGDGGPATSAQLSNPSGVALDPKGNLYIADTGDNEVRKLAPDGTITRFAGDGNYCASPPDCGDGNPATIAQLTQPSTVATDVGGDVYIADKGDNEIRRVTPDGRITRLAGTGRACTMTPACGDGGPAINSRLSSPSGVVIDGSYVYVADTADSEVRRFHAGGDIELVAGDGTRCTTAPACGDDGPATSAELSSPSGLATDESGTELYIADTGDHEVRKLALHTNTITRVAGDGIRCVQPPACGDGGDPTSATISFPGAVAFDSAGNLYIGDTQDQEIRRVG
jgi:DNA-binding beta-propeller fold protein YncE